MVLLLALDAPQDEAMLASTSDAPLDTTMMVAEVNRAVTRLQETLSHITPQANAVDDDDDDITWHDAEWQ